MKSEYDIKNLNPRKNPYAKKLQKQATIESEFVKIEKIFQQINKTTLSDSHARDDNHD